MTFSTCEGSRVSRLAIAATIVALNLTGHTTLLGVESAVSVQRRQELSIARNEAYAAANVGDVQKAILVLTLFHQKWPSKRGADLSVGASLADLSFRLKNEGKIVLALSAAASAQLKLSSPEGRMSREQSIEALSLAGTLAEHVHGNAGQAKSLYQRILVLDPSRVATREKLERIMAMERAAEAKVAGNTLLQQRKGEGRKP